MWTTVHSNRREKVGSLSGRGAKKGKVRKAKGIWLGGSSSWTSANIKKVWTRTETRGRQRSSTRLSEIGVKKEVQRVTWRDSRDRQRWERTGRGGSGSWHILQLPLLTGIRSCQSLSTCHSSALIGGLSLQIAQIKIPHCRGTGLDPHLPDNTATCPPTQSPTLSERGKHSGEKGRQKVKDIESNKGMKSN